jgi:hypothetical protein
VNWFINCCLWKSWTTYFLFHMIYICASTILTTNWAISTSFCHYLFEITFFTSFSQSFNSLFYVRDVVDWSRYWTRLKIRSIFMSIRLEFALIGLSFKIIFFWFFVCLFVLFWRTI